MILFSWISIKKLLGGNYSVSSKKHYISRCIIFGVITVYLAQEAIPVLRFAHMAHEAVRLQALCPQPGHGGCHVGLLAAADHHLGPLLGEPPGCGKPHAASTSQPASDFSGKIAIPHFIIVILEGCENLKHAR